MKKRKLKDFHKLEVELKGIDEIIEKYSSKTADELRTKPVWERNRLRGRRYNDGWTHDVFIHKKKEYLGTVYNATDWQLTWLLENGHLVTNKKGGVGWASPHKHIHEAFEANVDGFVSDMKEIDIDITVK